MYQHETALEGIGMTVMTRVTTHDSASRAGAVCQDQSNVTVLWRSVGSRLFGSYSRLGLLTLVCLLFAAALFPGPVSASSRYPQIQLGTTVSGQLSGDHTDDWYRVELPHPGRLAVRAESAMDLTITLRLYYDQDVLAADTGGASHTREVHRGDLYTGTYIVRVTRTAGSGSYSLHAAHRATLYREDAFANDSVDTAQLIAVNEESQGLLGYVAGGPVDSEDWYMITTSSPGQLAVDIAAEQSLTLSARLYASDGSTVLAADTSGSNSQRLVERSDLKAQTYFVRITRTSGYGGYSLWPRFAAEAVPLEGLAGDTMGLASSIPLDRTTIGLLGYTDGKQMDTEAWYVVDVSQPGSLTVAVDAQNSLTLVVRFYGLDGSAVLEADTGGSRSSRVIHRPDLAAGTYYLRVSRTQGYGGYTVQPQFDPQSIAPDLEPNDTAAQAAAIPLNALSTGLLGYSDGQRTDTEDWFALDVPASGELAVTVQAQDGLGIHLRLYDSSGSNVLQAETAGTAAVRTVQRPDLAAGTYYLRVSRSIGHGAYVITPVFARAPSVSQEAAGQMADAPGLALDEPQSALLGYGAVGPVPADSWLRLRQPTMGPLQVSLVMQEPLEATLRLYNEWGNVVVRSDTTGAASARLVNVNSQAGGIYNLRISRSGGQGAYSVMASMAGRGVWSNPLAHTFPAVQIDTAGPTMAIAIVNASQDSVRIQEVRLTGADVEAFRVESGGTEVIPPRDQRVFGITFRPTEPGIKEAALEVVTAVGSVVVPLVGTAYEVFPTELALDAAVQAEPLPGRLPDQAQPRGPEATPETDGLAWTEWQFYGPRERVVVHWQGLPGDAYDWIAVALQGAADDRYRSWVYTDGRQEGSVDFGHLPAGEYEVRVYYAWPSGGYEVQSRYAFVVRDPFARSQDSAQSDAEMDASPLISVGERRLYDFTAVPFAMRLAPAAAFPTLSDDSRMTAVERGFWLAETPVTYALWYDVRTWAEEHGYRFANPGQEGSEGAVGELPTGRSAEPVTSISWYDAVVWSNALSQWAGLEPVYVFEGMVLRDATERSALERLTAADHNGFRLPASKEWELAARYLGERRPQEGALAVEALFMDGLYWTPGSYASGATANFRDEEATTAAAWSYENSSEGAGGVHSTQPVGSKPPTGNALGLFDMSGNVWEWCFDERMGQRVQRGGSWFELTVTQQIGGVRTEEPHTVRDTRGFRLAQSQF